MSNFLKRTINTIFLFIVFLLFVVALVIFVLSGGGAYSSSCLNYFVNLLYFSGIIPLFFAFWLVFSDQTRGDWKFGLLAFVLFIFLLYSHYLSIYYALASHLTFVTNYRYLLILDEIILLYILMAVASFLSVGLKNDGDLQQREDLAVSNSWFCFLLTFFLLSLFAVSFYENFYDYTQTNLAIANFSVKEFPYLILLQALLNSGLLPLVFILWLVYSSLVKGNVYYYIALVFILVFIYSFQEFFVVHYYHAYPNNHLGYWLLEAICLVMVYLAIKISVIFAVKPAANKPEEHHQQCH